MKTVAVCEAKVPFVTGGAELHVTGLVNELHGTAIAPSGSQFPSWVPEKRTAGSGRCMAVDRLE